MFKAWFLFALAAMVCPKLVAAAEDGAVYLQPWVVGIIAVAVFLVVAFAFLLFEHFVCQKLYVRDDGEDFDDMPEGNGKLEEQITTNQYSTTQAGADSDSIGKVSISSQPKKSHVYENVAFVEEVTEL